MSCHTHPDPLTRAQNIFEDSTGSLMAHTIRATMNWFKRKGVDLDVWVSPDTAEQILSKFGGERKPPSVLLSSFYPGKKPRVVALIFIHHHANRNLARICIAHEIFHLLCELHHWIDNERKQWEMIKMSEHLEDLCNKFAWELCESHDKFNRDETNRKEQIYFPKDLFKTPLDMNETRKGNWPDGLAYDEQNPFYKRSKPAK